jgi:hypothetical protein
MGSGKSLSPGALGMVVTFVILGVAAELRADDGKLFPTGDVGHDILSKLSASLSHQMMHIGGPGAHRFVAAVGWRQRAPAQAAMRLASAGIGTVSFARFHK